MQARYSKLQAAAVKIQDAQAAESAARSEADSAQAVAEARDEEAANLRRQLAELQGTLSVQQDMEVQPFLLRLLNSTVAASLAKLPISCLNSPSS